MSLWSTVVRSNFLIKLKSWEYWPFGIVQFPIFPYWLWLSLRSRSLVFFTASNPGITMGGMFGESKYDIIKKLPPALIPKTILIPLPTSAETVCKRMTEAGFAFPVIFKPDLGERGFMVKKIDSRHQIEPYIAQLRSNFLIQEFVDLPLEFGVFYRRYPDEPNGEVISIVMKEMLTVTGDGKSTLMNLILKKDRAKLHWKKLRVDFHDRLLEVLPEGENIELVSIGNHAQGTKFLDGAHLITDRLSGAFDKISKQVDGFYFGRYDIRCASLEDLRNGQVKILELNGCGAEPAHIYQPGYPFFKAIGVLLNHWKDIFVISRQNRKRGVRHVSIRDAWRFYSKFKSAIR